MAWFINDKLFEISEEKQKIKCKKCDTEYFRIKNSQCYGHKRDIEDKRCQDCRAAVSSNNFVLDDC